MTIGQIICKTHDESVVTFLTANNPLPNVARSHNRGLFSALIDNWKLYFAEFSQPV